MIGHSAYKMLKDEVRKCDQGQSQKHSEAGVETKVFVDPDVVLRVSGKVVAAKEVDQVGPEEAEGTKHAERDVLEKYGIWDGI